MSQALSRKYSLRQIPLLFILILFVAGYSASAQISIKGCVLDANNQEPIPYASIYVSEIKSGAIADEYGRFILHLQPGLYQMEIRSVGYTTLHTQLQVGKKSKEQTFKLKTATYGLKEVEVIGKGPKKDPAYPIMRQLIARTPIYEHMLKKYEAEVYTKGSLRVDKVPFFLKNLEEDGIKVKDLTNKRFVMESLAFLEFEHPNKYKKEIRAARSSVPEQLGADTTDYLQIVSYNVYAKNFSLDGMINMPSPIRTGALDTYSYKLENTIKEKDRKVYHISFKGRINDIKGELWVIDSIWCIQGMNLNIKNPNQINYNVDISLNALEENVYLPTNYGINMSINTMGFKMNMQYYSSLKYQSLTLNRNLLSIIQKDKDLHFQTDREANRHAQSLDNRLDTLGYHLPDKYMLPDKTLQERIRLDSLAFDRDSSYWDDIVTAPLTEEELDSYAKKDSLIKVFEKKRQLRGEGSSLQSIAAAMLLGHRYKLGKETTFGFNGVFRGLLYDYRYTDGFWLGQSLFLRHSFSKGVDLTIKPGLYYTTERKKLYWNSRIEFRYAPLSRGMLTLSAGRQSDDLAGPMASNSRLITFLSTISDGRGYLKLYDKKFLRLSNEIDIRPGLQLSLAIEGRQSKALAENHVWGIFKKNYFFFSLGSKDSLLYSMPDHRSLTIEGNIRYNPAPYYRINRYGRKQYVGEGVRAPIFDLTYRQAIPGGRTYDSDYIYLAGSVSQNIRLNPLYSIYYRVKGGSFLRNNMVHPDEQYYLKADNCPIQIGSSFNNSIQTLPSYSYANRNFLMLNTHWSFPALLKRGFSIIPPSIFSNLHLNAYWGCEKDKKPFFEIGYSRGTIGKIGIFYGGYNFYKDRAFMLRYTIAFPMTL